MKDKLLSFVVLPAIMFALFLAFSPVGVHGSEKIKLCHARDAVTNPYGPKAEEIDDDAILTSGHDGHNGPVWNSTMTNDDNWGDIIPPFDYGDGQHYAGKNWTTEGRAIWNNDCQPVVPPIRSDFNLTSMCKPSETEGRLRIRNQSDIAYDYILKLYGTSTQYTGSAAANFDTLITVPWTASDNTWILEIAGFSFRKAIGNNALCAPVMCEWDDSILATDESCQKPVMCKWNEELEADDPACPTDCQYDSTIPSTDESCKAPVMCEWNDQILATDENCQRPVMCKWNEELEADDPACPVDCQYDSTISSVDPLCAPKDDEPEVLGEDDDTTKDTGVVLAATGPTDNIVVYIVELLLVAMLVTYSVFFTKTYLKNSK